MKDLIINFISEITDLPKENVTFLIEIPPKEELGDFSFTCFSLAKELHQTPAKVAENFVKKMNKKLPIEIKEVKNVGGYLNFFVNQNIWAKMFLEKIKKDINLKIEKKNIGIEYPSPNTNKALHVGHLRNMAIGEAILKMSKIAGNNVFHLNLFNDRGILISKSMVAYEEFAEGKTPKSEEIKGDKFVGDLYVKFHQEVKNNPKLEDKAKEKLKLWEKEDKKTIELWEKMNSWAYEGIQETWDKFGLSKIDKNYYESEIYKKGKKIVEEGKKKGLFFEKDGAIIIDLSEEKLGEKVLLRSDGTSVYITQDLYLAEKKIEDFNLNDSYYIVGSDQEYHFKVLFSILEKLGVKGNFKHFSYGMVDLPSGKMKSRDGSIIPADDFIEEVKDLAKKGIIERSDNLQDPNINEKSLKIALAAIKYHLLKVDIKKNITFNPNEALSFEGDTGPYLLYSYARASSIIRKAKSKKEMNYKNLDKEEIKLIKKINDLENLFKRAYEQMAPNLIANYSYELAQTFNEFYHMCPVMGSEKEKFRLILVEEFRKTIRITLDVLGIEVLEEM